MLSMNWGVSSSYSKEKREVLKLDRSQIMKISCKYFLFFHQYEIFCFRKSNDNHYLWYFFYLFLETFIFKGTLIKLFSYALEGLLELLQYLYQLFFTKKTIDLNWKATGGRLYCPEFVCQYVHIKSMYSMVCHQINKIK